MLSVAGCVSSVAFSPSARSMSSVVFYTVSSGLLHAVPRVSSAALRSVGSCLLHVVCCPLHIARCLLFVACCLLPVCLPPCPMSHGVRCLPPDPRSISSRCMLRVVCSLLHVVSLTGACPILHYCCMPHVVCCRRCRATQRRRIRSASRRRSHLSASVAGEARCSADRGGRACVRACG